MFQEFWEVCFKGRGPFSPSPCFFLSLAWNVDVMAGARAAVLFQEWTLRRGAEQKKRSMFC